MDRSHSNGSKDKNCQLVKQLLGRHHNTIKGQHNRVVAALKRMGVSYLLPSPQPLLLQSPQPDLHSILRVQRRVVQVHRPGKRSAGRTVQGVFYVANSLGEETLLTHIHLFRVI